MNREGKSTIRMIILLYRHMDDIMCVTYNRDNQLIYTGGHDGSLIAWNFETGYIKYYLHELDPTCMSKNGNYILESKSVDCVSFNFS